jgi:hypothetical protein
MRSMQRYAISANYIQLKETNPNKGGTTDIDERPKASGNIVEFIKNTWLEITKKAPNFIFEGNDGNRVVICAIEIVVAREELLINYDLKWIYASVIIMEVLVFYCLHI